MCHKHKDRHRAQWGRIESPAINPHILGRLIFDELVKSIEWGTIVSSRNGAGTTGYR